MSLILFFPFCARLRAVEIYDVQEKIFCVILISTVLEFFLPDHVRQKVILDSIYRVQKLSKLLLELCQSSNNVTRLLLPSVSESGVFEIILTGINPETRTPRAVSRLCGPCRT